MVNGLGVFAGGLAQGLRAGQDMNLRQQYLNEQKKANLRDAQSHRARMENIDFNKEKRSRLKAANDEIVAGWQATATHPAQPRTAGLADLPGSAPAATADTRARGLSSLIKPVSHAQISSSEMIGKRMLTGKLLENADELTRMAKIYEKYGVQEEMTPWMNEAYTARKKRIPEALHFLLSGNAKGAGEILRGEGMKLEGDPLPTNPDDPLSHNWRFRFEDGGEKDIDIKQVAARFLPENYFRMQNQD
ncbi:MAG: hypothetical protein H0X43_02740 [Nitrosospira sp.]|nr:hypothetical protein [Nitrosospira sp.]